MSLRSWTAPRAFTERSRRLYSPLDRGHRRTGCAWTVQLPRSLCLLWVQNRSLKLGAFAKSGGPIPDFDCGAQPRLRPARGIDDDRAEQAAGRFTVGQPKTRHDAAYRAGAGAMCSGILPHCCLVAARATPPAPTEKGRQPYPGRPRRIPPTPQPQCVGVFFFTQTTAVRSGSRGAGAPAGSAERVTRSRDLPASFGFDVRFALDSGARADIARLPGWADCVAKVAAKATSRHTRGRRHRGSSVSPRGRPS